MKPIATAILLSSLASAVFATQQVPEVLVYNGTTNDMYSTPLESFFSAEKPKVFLEKPSSTACWRGYVGTWKIEDDQLYLVALQEGDPRTGAIPLDKVSPKWVSPVKAMWFTGTIQIGKGGGRGKVLTGSLEIRNGKVVPTRQDDKEERKTLIGRVPKDDFAMPLIAGEILPGNIQGCFITADTEECIVALYPKGMDRPGRDVAIQVNGRMQVVTSTAPSSPTGKIHMRYRQKVMVIESWAHNK